MAVFGGSEILVHLSEGNGMMYNIPTPTYYVYSHNLPEMPYAYCTFLEGYEMFYVREKLFPRALANNETLQIEIEQDDNPYVTALFFFSVHVIFIMNIHCKFPYFRYESLIAGPLYQLIFRGIIAPMYL